MPRSLGCMFGMQKTYTNQFLKNTEKITTKPPGKSMENIFFPGCSFLAPFGFLAPDCFFWPTFFLPPFFVWSPPVFFLPPLRFAISPFQQREGTSTGKAVVDVTRKQPIKPRFAKGQGRLKSLFFRQDESEMATAQVASQQDAGLFPCAAATVAPNG